MSGAGGDAPLDQLDVGTKAGVTKIAGDCFTVDAPIFGVQCVAQLATFADGDYHS